MSFILGLIIITSAFYIPSPMPIGIFWSALIVAVPSLVVGSYARFKFLWFSLGALLACMVIIVLNFGRWEDMAFILSVLQIIPVFSAIFSFLFGWVLFGSVKIRNNTLKQERKKATHP